MNVDWDMVIRTISFVVGVLLTVGIKAVVTTHKAKKNSDYSKKVSTTLENAIEGWFILANAKAESEKSDYSKATHRYNRAIDAYQSCKRAYELHPNEPFVGSRLESAEKELLMAQAELHTTKK